MKGEDGQKGYHIGREGNSLGQQLSQLLKNFIVLLRDGSTGGLVCGVFGIIKVRVVKGEK